MRRLARTSSALEQVIAALAAKVDLETSSKAPYLALQATAAFVRAYAWQ
jgi:hypothetical protein